MAGEEINGGINFRWQDNLSQAQASVVKFLGSLDKLNKILESVVNKQLDAAGASDALGGVSERTAEQLKLLELGSLKLAEVQELLGISSVDVTAKISALAAGNMVLSAAMKSAGVDVTKLAVSDEALAAAKVRLLELEQAVAAATTKRTVAVKAQTAAVEKNFAADAAVANLMREDEAAAYRLEKALKKLAAAKAALSVAGGQGTLPFKSLGLSGDPEKLARDLTRVARETERIKGWTSGFRAPDSTTGRQMNLPFSGGLKPLGDFEASMDNALTKMMPIRRETSLLSKAFSLLSFDAEKSVTTVTGMFTRFMNGLLGAGRGVATLTTSVYGLVALIAGAAIGGLTKYTAHFEQKMLEIGVLIRGNTTYLEDQVKRLSQLGGLSPIDVASGMKESVQMVGAKDASAFLEQAVKLSVTHQMSLEKSLEMLRSLKKEYHLTTDQLSAMRDVLFEMAQRGVTDLEGLSSEVARLAPTAKAAGLSLREMLAAVTTLVQAGHTPANAVAILGQALTAITDPAQEAKKELDGFNVELGPAAIKGKTFAKVMADLHDALVKNPELLAALSNNMRSLAGFQELSDHVGELKDNMSALVGATGEADVAFTKLNEGPGQRLERLLATLKVAAIEAGEGMVTAGQKWIKANGGMHASQLRLLALVKQVQLGVMTFVHVFYTGFQILYGVVQLVWGGLKQIWDLISVISKLFTSALIAPFQLLVMGLKSLFMVLQEASDALGLGGDEDFWNPVINGLDEAETAINKFQKSLIDGATYSMGEFGRDGAEAMKRLGERVDDIGESGMALVKLGQEIADLRHEADMAEAAAKKLSIAVKTVAPGAQLPAEKTDDTELKRQRLLKLTEDYIKKSIEGLKLWKETGSKALGEQESALKSFYTKQVALAKRADEEMRRLDEARLQFDESLHEKLFNLQQGLRKPRQQQEALRGEALFMEQAANNAARAGNLKGVEKSLDKAIKFWEDLLKLDPSRQRVEEVMGHLKRLGAGMDTVYDKERSAQQETAKDATALAAEAQHRLQDLHKARGEFEKSFAEMLDQYKNVGVITQAKLDALKQKVDAVQHQADLVIKIDTSESMKTLDALILKMKEVQDVDVMPTEPKPWFIPPSSSPLNGGSSSTNVDLGGVHIDYHATPGSTSTDARRLARQVLRHIERGEVAPLGGK